MRPPFYVSLLFLTALLIGCSETAPTPLPTAPPALLGNALVGEAKREGQVTVYTSLTEIPALAAEFTKAYPEIKVDAVRLTSEDVTTRVLSAD